MSRPNKAAFGEYGDNSKNRAGLKIDAIAVPERVIPDIGPISPPLGSSKGGPLLPVPDPEGLLSGASIDS